MSVFKSRDLAVISRWDGWRYHKHYEILYYNAKFWLAAIGRNRSRDAIVSQWAPISNLVLRTFSSFKMAVGETPGQGCWNSPRIVTHDEMTFSEVVFFFFGGCFQRLAALFVFCNLKPLFKRSEDISSYLRDKILTNFGTILAALARGFSDRHFERGEGPGDEVGLSAHSARFWQFSLKI